MDQLNFKSKDFVHLHLHSDYSLLQSTIKLKPLAERLKTLEMQACALTDYGNMYGAVAFYNATKSAGVRSIIGYEAHVTHASRHDRDSSVAAGERPYYNLVLLAKDYAGYKNLVYLASKAFTEGLHHKPRIDLELLAERGEGLIGLTAGPNGCLRHYVRQGELAKAAVALKRYEDALGKGNLFLEISDHGTEDCPKNIKDSIELSKRCGIPLVATNDAHYLSEDDARAHEVLLCIGDGRTLVDGGRYTFPSTKYYLRSADEMWEIFGKELPEALSNTLKIAEMCEVELPVGGSNYELPVYPVPADSGCSNVDQYFEKVLAETFESRNSAVWSPMLASGKLKYTLDDYRNRLNREIGVIRKMGF